MALVCKRLPATEDTLQFLSPYFMQERMLKAVDDRLSGSWYAVYRLFDAIRSGVKRCYGVFELDDSGHVSRFIGFELAYLEGEEGNLLIHSFWNHGADAVQCLKLCKEVMLEDYAKEGIAVKFCIGLIPEPLRAARLMALRAGAVDLGKDQKIVWQKNGKSFPVRVFRFDLKQNLKG